MAGGGFQFIPARHFTPTSGRKIDLIVLHSMEAPEKGSTAEDVARYFSRTNVKASAHYNIDADSIVQSVQDQDVAYAAPGANHNGLQLEHAGYARQSRNDWLDPYSRDMLQRSADLTALRISKYGIPVEFVNAAGLKAGRRGITTHFEVSQAFRKSTHTDPGPGFPIDIYLDLVRRSSGQTTFATKGDAMSAAIEPIGFASRPGGGGAVFGRRGHVYSFDGAPHFGGWPEGQAGPTNRDGRDCIGGVWTLTGQGYWLISDAGETYAYGDAPHPGNYRPDWGPGQIIGAFVNDRTIPTGGLTLVRNDLNLYRLPA